MKTEKWHIEIDFRDKPENGEPYLSPHDIVKQLEKCFGYLEAGLKAKVTKIDRI